MSRSLKPGKREKVDDNLLAELDRRVKKLIAERWTNENFIGQPGHHTAITCQAGPSIVLTLRDGAYRLRFWRQVAANSPTRCN
jgi:hypothetical protein